MKLRLREEEIMSNNLQIFKNNDFGEIRVIELNGEP